MFYKFINGLLILQSNGFMCLLKNTIVPKRGEEEKLLAESSELLPRNWNQNPDLYEIYYIDGLGHLFLLKAVNLEHQIILNIVKFKNESLTSLTLEQEPWIGSDYRDFNEAFKKNSRKELGSILEKKLITPFREMSSRESSFEGVSSGISEPLVFLPASSTTDEPSVDCTFAVGRGDLDFLGRGGPGMLVQDIHRHHLQQPQPGYFLKTVLSLMIVLTVVFHELYDLFFFVRYPTKSATRSCATWGSFRSFRSATSRSDTLYSYKTTRFWYT